MEHPLLENYDRFIEPVKACSLPGAANEANSIWYGITRKVTIRLLEKYGDELYPSGTRYLTGIHGIDQSMALYHRFSHRISMGTVDFTDMISFDSPGSIEIIVDEIYEELKNEKQNLEKQGYEWFPYLAAIPSGVCIDPLTFEPTVKFYGRFGSKKLNA